MAIVRAQAAAKIGHASTHHLGERVHRRAVVVLEHRIHRDRRNTARRRGWAARPVAGVRQRRGRLIADQAVDRAAYLPKGIADLRRHLADLAVDHAIDHRAAGSRRRRLDGHRHRRPAETRVGDGRPVADIGLVGAAVEVPRQYALQLIHRNRRGATGSARRARADKSVAVWLRGGRGRHHLAGDRIVGHCARQLHRARDAVGIDVPGGRRRAAIRLCRCAVEWHTAGRVYRASGHTAIRAAYRVRAVERLCRHRLRSIACCVRAAELLRAHALSLHILGNRRVPRVADLDDLSRGGIDGIAEVVHRVGGDGGRGDTAGRRGGLQRVIKPRGVGTVNTLRCRRDGVVGWRDAARIDLRARRRVGEGGVAGRSVWDINVGYRDAAGQRRLVLRNKFAAIFSRQPTIR